MLYLMGTPIYLLLVHGTKDELKPYQHKRRLNVATNTCRHCKISMIFDLGNLMALDNNIYQTPAAGSAIGAKGIIQCFVFRLYSQIINHLKP
jgi:hypothetical protein